MASLFEQATNLQTLEDGFDRVEENHGAPGTDGQTIEEFSSSLDLNLSLLQSELEAGAYRPRPLLRVSIPKHDGGTRELAIPAVRDRVVQSAAYLTLEPLLEPEFEDVSFAFRPGRSVDQALQRLLHYRDQGYTWVLDADIHRFFDEIPHEKLFAVVTRYVPDPQIVDLIKLWVCSEVWAAGKRYLQTTGVPQGSPLSPLLANLYLDGFDEALIRHKLRVIRFADDFVVLCRSREEGEQAREVTEGALRELGLSLNSDKTRVVSFEEGFRYLGVQFLRSMAFRPLYADWKDQRDAESGLEPRPELVPAGAGPTERTTVGSAMSSALKSLSPGEAAHRWADLHGSRKEPEAAPTLPDLAPSDYTHVPTLRTLYLIKQGAELGKEDERFVVRLGESLLEKIPALKVDQILIFGNIRISTPALQFCLLHDIPIYLLSSRGRYYGVVEATTGSRVHIHAQQFRRVADDEFRLAVSRGIVRGKLANSRTVLQRMVRANGRESVQAACDKLRELRKHVDAATSLDQLRGIEGAGAAAYFSAIGSLLKAEWRFSRRERQPPPDPINSMLSFGYTLLFYNTYSMVRAVGLQPYVGLFHSLQDNHPALVSDLMEEFRAPVVDRTVLTLVSSGAVTPADFRPPSEGQPGCFLTEEARRTVSIAFEKALGRPTRHPDAGERCDFRRAILLQAQRLLGVVEGRLLIYEPFEIR